MWLLPQVRVPMDKVASVMRSLSDMETSWDDVKKIYPAQKDSPDVAE